MKQPKQSLTTLPCFCCFFTTNKRYLKNMQCRLNCSVFIKYKNIISVTSFFSYDITTSCDIECVPAEWFHVCWSAIGLEARHLLLVRAPLELEIFQHNDEVSKWFAFVQLQDLSTLTVGKTDGIASNLLV